MFRKKKEVPYSSWLGYLDISRYIKIYIYIKSHLHEFSHPLDMAPISCRQEKFRQALRSLLKQLDSEDLAGAMERLGAIGTPPVRGTQVGMPWGGAVRSRSGWGNAN